MICLVTLLAACAGDVTEVETSGASPHRQALSSDRPVGEVSACGDGFCDVFETPQTCPWDCEGSFCGDGSCSPEEDMWTCEIDCSVCGDGHCTGVEDPYNCVNDCGYCGDGFCSTTETPGTCAPDCPSCGDGVCNDGETATSCPADCSTSPAVVLGRFSRWCGKVNIHTSPTGSWTPDPDCNSGCNIGGLTYCQKFWPASTRIRQVALTPKPTSGAWTTQGCHVWVEDWPGDDEFECVK